MNPNIVLITADDMNYNSPGFKGGIVDDITPNIDSLAGEGMQFEHAHVTVAVCQPSRQCMMTGRYPHRNGAPGFDPIDEDIPTLQEELRGCGYINGIIGKVDHLAPEYKYAWDSVTYMWNKENGYGRNPQLYHDRTKEFFHLASEEDKPFFLMVNILDPHRPFAGSDQEIDMIGHHMDASRFYEPDEIDVPGFLPDIKDVRKEVAQYMTSVHRCDESVGEIIRAIRESDLEQNTVVMFLSDNGMAFPFAKTNCYLNSTKTPWIVRWPGVVAPGLVDRKHFISGIDYMPTILDIVGVKVTDGLDGRSFLPLLQGVDHKGRETVFTLHNVTAGKRAYPMRCIQNSRFGYIFNAWSDQKTMFINESKDGLTYNAMKAAEDYNDAVKERVQFFDYRVNEELYDFERDPNALNNLMQEEGYQEMAKRLKAALLEDMMTSNDPLVGEYEKVM